MAAATLAPLWDYGFEVRHDNVVLTSILLIWWAVRARPMGLSSYLLAGAVAIASLFIAVKAVVYVVPLSMAILAFPPPAHQRSRWHLALAWLAGALSAAVIIRLCYGTGGKWELYLSVFQGVSKVSGGGGDTARFWPWGTLSRLFSQVPLLLTMTAAACFAATADLWRRRKAGLNWDGILPEIFLLAVAFGGLVANPTPFPYNLLHVVPYAFLLAFRYGADVWKQLQDSARLWPLAATVIIFAHLVPFGDAVRRHLHYSNSRQTTLMSLAEDLTDAAKDPVYDGIGLVPTRRTIHFQWYLHSLNIQSFRNQPGLRVRDMLAHARLRSSFPTTAPIGFRRKTMRSFVNVTCPWQTISGSWGRLFLAAAARLRSFIRGAIASLRSRIRTWRRHAAWLPGACRPDRTLGSFSAMVDGVPVPGHPVELTVGTHRFEAKPGCQAAVVWVGPQRDRVGRLSPSDHRTLFVNWY